MLTISSPNFGGTRGKVIWIIIHTAEGATNVTALGNYFAKSSAQASSHVGIDDQQIAQYVPYDKQAWTARSANPYADQAELCAFAAWTRAQWLAHPGMLENTAQWIAERCKARGIPPVKISSADVAARRSGVIGHINVTEGLRDGTHTDPGPNFPWDVVMSRAQQIVNGEDMPLTQQDIDAVVTAIYNAAIPRSGTKADGSPQAGKTNLLSTLAWLDSNFAGLAAAIGKSVDPKAVADAIVSQLPASDAQKVATLVLAGLNGAQLNVTQPS